MTRKVLRVNLYDLVAKGTALLGFLLFDRAAVEPTGWIRFLPTVAMMRSGPLGEMVQQTRSIPIRLARLAILPS